jgi:hypothetical protein
VIAIVAMKKVDNQKINITLLIVVMRKVKKQKGIVTAVNVTKKVN